MPLWNNSACAGTRAVALLAIGRFDVLGSDGCIVTISGCPYHRFGTHLVNVKVNSDFISSFFLRVPQLVQNAGCTAPPHRLQSRSKLSQT